MSIRRAGGDDEDTGLFGLNVPDESAQTRSTTQPSPWFSRKLSRGGWTGRNHRSHSVLCDVWSGSVRTTRNNGFCPALRRAEPRGGICSRSRTRTDLQAITTIARRDGDIYYVTGSKIGYNGDMASLFFCS